jgi:hypothetical protein
MFSMGGACAAIPPTDSAYFYRQAAFFLDYSAQWLKQSEDKKHLVELDTLRAKLSPYTVGDYVGNPDRNLKDYLQAYFGDNVERLRYVKRKYDPDHLFQFEQGVPAAEK